MTSPAYSDSWPSWRSMTSIVLNALTATLSPPARPAEPNASSFRDTHMRSRAASGESLSASSDAPARMRRWVIVIAGGQ
jgi:hypothetical protein